MVVDPFGAVVKDGRLYGRGACDVKGGLAAMLAALVKLHATKALSAGKVHLAMTVDEEHNFSGIHALAKSGIRADFAIVAEPTQLDIVTAHKGVTRWTIETMGKACHCSTPALGDNAIYHMARVVYEVETFAETLSDRPKHPTLGRPTLSLGRIDGGTSTNTVPDSCRIELDRRLVPGETATSAVAELTDFLQNDPNTADLPMRVSAPLFICPPLAPNQPEEWLHKLGHAMERVTGRVHERVAVPFGTNASTLAEAGIPSVVFGPGSIAQAHTKDEWIELKSVEHAAEILFRFLAG
jgi:acetylornithine deacetylase